MKRPSRLLALALLIPAIYFVGCDDDSEDNAYDLYVYGNINQKGTVWVNGTEQAQPLLSLFLLGSSAEEKDFYVAGIGEGGVPVKAVAKYWKNGNEVALSNGTEQEWATDVAVSGSDVYVSGYDAGVNGSSIRAKYWKNGNEVILAENTDVNASGATDVIVSGTDFYVLGWENVNNNEEIGARVWKNGVRMQVAADSQYYYVDGIAVSGNDVHLVGYESNDLGYRKPKYWKNGVGTYFNDGFPNEIVVKGNDVYIAGTKNGKTGYWKNDVFTEVTDQNVGIVSIAVYGNDVILAGNLFSNRAGIVWKNGIPVAPFLGTDPKIYVNGAVGVKR
jgi:hypothetical protein